MNAAERAAVTLIRRTAEKERRLAKQLRETSGLRAELAAARRSERAMRKGLENLRALLLAKGRDALFSDVMDGIGYALQGHAYMPPYWRHEIETAKKRLSRLGPAPRRDQTLEDG